MDENDEILQQLTELKGEQIFLASRNIANLSQRRNILKKFESSKRVTILFWG